MSFIKPTETPGQRKRMLQRALEAWRKTVSSLYESLNLRPGNHAGLMLLRGKTKDGRARLAIRQILAGEKKIETFVHVIGLIDRDLNKRQAAELRQQKEAQAIL